MSIRISLFLFLGLLCSCQVYQSSFDCPPCKGVPCTSVSEIKKMIIETPEGGPDIFLENPYCDKEISEHRYSSNHCQNNRIWMEDIECSCDCNHGDYIYFRESYQ